MAPLDRDPQPSVRWPSLAVGFAGASAVLLGALGAHTLRDVLDAHSLVIWETAVRFQFWHTLALVTGVLLLPRARIARVACVLFGFGMLLFCGSLYALALGAAGWIGAITPLGGLALVAGWLASAAALWSRSG